MIDSNFFDNNGSLLMCNVLEYSRHRSNVKIDEHSSEKIANKVYPEYIYIERCQEFVRNIPYSTNPKDIILHNLRWPEDYIDMGNFIPLSPIGISNDEVFGYDQSMEDLKHTDYKIDYVSAIDRSFTSLLEEFDINSDADMVDVVLKLPAYVAFKVDEYEIRLLKDLIEQHPNLKPRIVIVLYEPTNLADACSVQIDYLGFKKE